MFVTLGGAAVALIVAAVARRSGLRAAEEEADLTVERIAWNIEFGHPLGSTPTGATPRKRLRADLPPCHGKLLVHEDGHQTCVGGRDDCWPEHETTYSHRRTAACNAQNHGCGTCQTPGYQPAAGPDRSHY
jgi:hypothetical protein